MAPAECFDPRDQLAEGKWLDQVVVGTDVEPMHTILDRTASCQHQDLAVHPLLTEAPSHGKAVTGRQHDVQDDHVVGGCQRHGQRLFAVGDGVNGHPRLLQSTVQARGEPVVVLYHQDSHATFLPEVQPRSLIRSPYTFDNFPTNMTQSSAPTVASPAPGGRDEIDGYALHISFLSPAGQEVRRRKRSGSKRPPR